MFSVIFEVHPKSSLWNDYLALGNMLKPEFEQIDSFIENVRYRSLTREGWLVSLSQWRDGAASVSLEITGCLTAEKHPNSILTQRDHLRYIHRCLVKRSSRGRKQTKSLVVSA